MRKFMRPFIYKKYINLVFTINNLKPIFLRCKKTYSDFGEDLVIEKLFTRNTSGPVWKIFKNLFTLFVRNFCFRLKKIWSRVLTTKFNPIMSSLQFLLTHWLTDNTRRQADAVLSQASLHFSTAMRNVWRIGENAEKKTFW